MDASSSSAADGGDDDADGGEVGSAVSLEAQAAQAGAEAARAVAQASARSASSSTPRYAGYVSPRGNDDFIDRLLEAGRAASPARPVSGHSTAAAEEEYDADELTARSQREAFGTMSSSRAPSSRPSSSRRSPRPPQSPHPPPQSPRRPTTPPSSSRAGAVDVTGEGGDALTPLAEPPEPMPETVEGVNVPRNVFTTAFEQLAASLKGRPF